MAFLNQNATAQDIMNALNDIAAINNRADLVNRINEIEANGDMSFKTILVNKLNALGINATTSETWSSLLNKVSKDANLVPDNIKAGTTIYGVTGSTSVVDTSNSNATAAQIRNGQTAYVNGSKIIGTMPIQATSSQTITPTTANIVKAAGIYDGDITIVGDPNLIASNILNGKTIFGITGIGINGRRYASGKGNVDSTRILTVTGLSFVPSTILISAGGSYAANNSDYAGELLAVYSKYLNWRYVSDNWNGAQLNPIMLASNYDLTVTSNGFTYRSRNWFQAGNNYSWEAFE